MSYNKTLNLPRTKFPMRANLAKNEPKLLERWDAEGLYDQIIAQNGKSPKFLMHDGPPYANGHIHAGHILNKILKDMIVKYRNLLGQLCEFVPGWDCHGLPIEVQVDKKLGKKKREMTAVEFRRACREYASSFVEIQRKEFKRFGVFARWEEPYLTMDYKYEANIVREVGKFFLNGSIYKGKKPVHWCPNHRTALAEAELEYQDHTSPSIYVKFPLKAETWPFEEARKPVSVVIWTTTPWTLPANLAICLHPDFEYAVVELESDLLIIASELVEAVAEACGLSDYSVVRKFKGSEFDGVVCRHPFIERDSGIVFADYVTLETGTGCVHTAPGHGVDDYKTGLKYGLEPYAPVDNAGRFTDEVPQWAGLKVFAANKPIVDHLHEIGALLNQPGESITHSYPHSWRSHKPVIFRATEQWFISMESNELRQRALDEIDRVNWVPHWGRNRIYSMVENRPDWCISRQRLWGVPIPAFICADCGGTNVTEEILEFLTALIEEHSTDIWYDREAAELMPPGTNCQHCGHGVLEKDRNILDVWFESGVSYAAVMEQLEHHGVKTDLYIEGSDQHRGWFHSSLLASVGTRRVAPYKSVITHGFVVDGQGKKISKSKGNFIPPEQIIQKNGAEILRLWVCAEDYREDIRLSNEIIARLSEAYRKIRNTCRFMLGVVGDFDPEKDRVPFEELEVIDRWKLSQFQRLIDRIRSSYEEYTFHIIFHSVVEFVTVQLSAFYLDILKDRLYVEGASSATRRRAQTVIYEVLRSLTIILAPILSFTAEEIWNYLPRREGDPESVFLASFPESDPSLLDEGLEQEWAALKDLRTEALKELEAARADKLIGNALDARVVVRVSETHPALSTLEKYRDQLASIFIVSQVELTTAGDLPPDVPFEVSVVKAEGEKCERCWIYTDDVGSDVGHATICTRCAETMNMYYPDGAPE